MHWLLHMLYFVVPAGRFTGYGLCIIFLTVLVRGSMFPLSRRQAGSSAKMQEKMAELAPEVRKRDFLAAAAREWIAVWDNLLAWSGDLIAERARELSVRRIRKVTFEGPGGLQHQIGERRRKPVRIRPQAPDLRLQ